MRCSRLERSNNRGDPLDHDRMKNRPEMAKSQSNRIGGAGIKHRSLLRPRLDVAGRVLHFASLRCLSYVMLRQGGRMLSYGGKGHIARLFHMLSRLDQYNQNKITTTTTNSGASFSFFVYRWLQIGLRSLVHSLAELMISFLIFGFRARSSVAHLVGQTPCCIICCLLNDPFLTTLLRRRSLLSHSSAINYVAFMKNYRVLGADYGWRRIRF
jgi:hypothetical protein